MGSGHDRKEGIAADYPVFHIFQIISGVLQVDDRVQSPVQDAVIKFGYIFSGKFKRNIRVTDMKVRQQI